MPALRKPARAAARSGPSPSYCHGVAATRRCAHRHRGRGVAGRPRSIQVNGPALTTGDAALFIYTSGTTGLPKAARITHGRVLRIMLGFSGAAGARASDRMYNCLPM